MMPAGFGLTCDTTSGHAPPQLYVGTRGFFRVTDFDISASTVRVAHSGPILNISSHGPAFYFEGEGTMDGSEPRIFERREAPFSLSPRNELILMGCNANATVYEDDGDAMAISGCTSFCPDHMRGSWVAKAMRSCYGMGCCRSPVSVSTNGMLPSVVGYSQIEENRPMDDGYVLIAEAGWFDDQHHQRNYSSDKSWWSVAAQHVPMLLQWEVLPLPGLPKPDARSHPSCTQEVTQKLCKSVHSYCSPGNRGYTCHCEQSYDGNPYSPDDDRCKGGHGKHLTTEKGNNRLCGNVRVPYPFWIEQGSSRDEPSSSSSYMMPAGFGLTCDTTSGHAPPQLYVGTRGFFRVTDFDISASTVRVAHSGPILNISSHGPAFYFEGEGTMDGSEPRIFERREAPFSLSPRNELILMGCNANATVYEDDGDAMAISGCTSFCPDHMRGSWVAKAMRSCYGMGCCRSPVSVSTNGMLPSVVGYSQIEENRPMDDGYVLIAEAGWFDDQHHQRNYSSDKSWWSVAAQHVPMLLQWEVLPLPGLPKPDARSHPSCTQEVTQKLCKSVHSYCSPGNRGYTCHCEQSYDGNPYSPDDDGCKGGHGKHLTTGE
uniref:Uncharacterized protein n=1 Tax=Avena sativa TaxID=4498 RepID=A0ACD6AJQ9_AVESA